MSAHQDSSRCDQFHFMTNEKPKKAQVSAPIAAVAVCLVVLICAALYLWKAQPPGTVNVTEKPRVMAETPAQLKENDAFLKKLAGLPVNKRARLLALNPTIGQQLAFSPNSAQKKKLQSLIPL